MRKSLAQISSQISSDPPDETYTMGLTDPSFMTKIGNDTKKEWHNNAQGVIKQAKADTANIVVKYDSAVNVRYKQELNGIYIKLHANLAPINKTIEQLMVDFMLLEEEIRGLVLQLNEEASKAEEKVQGMAKRVRLVVEEVINDEKAAVLSFDKSMGRNKRPRKTDETVVPSDEE